MFETVRLQRFKPWKDTGELRLAPLTGFFGTNSSGKSSIVQFLLMLKQTCESPDRRRVLHTGDERTYVDLGTFSDLIYGHDSSRSLLASQANGATISMGRGRRRQTVAERVAYWLKTMGLIDSFKLAPLAENRKDYEVRVRVSPGGPEVLITDVGFGVSQVLPVLVLCYYVPEGATIILEQPEIHLHPFVQSALANALVDVERRRGV